MTDGVGQGREMRYSCRSLNDFKESLYVTIQLHIEIPQKKKKTASPSGLFFANTVSTLFLLSFFARNRVVSH